MKRSLPLCLAFSLLAAATPPAAQTPAPQPPAAAPQEPERKPAGGKPLNLKLDDADRRQIMSGSSAQEIRDAGDNLPALGGDARPLPPRDPPSSNTQSYPQDTERREK